MDTPNFNVNPNAVTPQPPRKSAVGPFIGLIIILVIIIMGSLYFWGKRVDEKLQNIDNVPVPQTGTVTEDRQTTQLQAQGSTDDLESIEADLNAIDFGNIDAGIEELQ